MFAVLTGLGGSLLGPAVSEQLLPKILQAFLLTTNYQKLALHWRVANTGIAVMSVPNVSAAAATLCLASAGGIVGTPVFSCILTGRGHRRGTSGGSGGDGGGRRKGLVSRSMDRMFHRRKTSPFEDEPLVCFPRNDDIILILDSISP